MRFRVFTLFLFAISFFAAVQIGPVGADDGFLVLKRIKEIRESIIRDPIRFTKVNTGSSHPLFVKVMSDRKFLSDFFKASIPIMGCSDEDHRVFGFYNPVQAVWAITWTDLKGRPYDSRIVRDFTRRGSSVNSWYDSLSPSRDALRALEESLKYQLESFSILFPPQNCATPENIDDIASNISGQAQLWSNRSEIDTVPDSLIESVANELSKNAAIGKDQIVLAFAAPNVQGFDFVTLSTIKDKPSLIVVQTWDRSGNKWVEREFSARQILEL